MKTLEEKIKVMQAYKEGKHVEFKCLNEDWVGAPTPCWDWYTYDYRIKEEPKKKVKLYLALCLDNHGDYLITSRFYSTIKEAQDFLTLFKVIKLLPHTMIEIEKE